MNKHLSTAQISGWITGERAPECVRHLQECEACRSDLSEFESGLAALGPSIRHWARQQDAARNPAIRVRSRPAQVSWRWGLAAIAVGVVAFLPVRWSREAQREAALREDAELLEHIDAQLSRAVPATMEPLMSLMQEGKDEHE